MRRWVSFHGIALNIGGEVTGNAATTLSPALAYTTTANAGQLTSLGTLGGLTSHGFGINDSGTVRP